MRVLGIDPGTAVMGYGVIETGPSRQPRLVECGTLTTPRIRKGTARQARKTYFGAAPT